jgi:hypothetical protein
MHPNDAHLIDSMIDVLYGYRRYKVDTWKIIPVPTLVDFPLNKRRYITTLTCHQLLWNGIF